MKKRDQTNIKAVFININKKQKQRKNMKITKIAIAVIASFAVSVISFAGELSVTGTAKATYSIQGSESTTAVNGAGKGIGIANEFSLNASGETDQGIAWVYAQDIDGATVQDDAKLTLTMPTYGTFGIFVSEGGLSSKYKWDVSAYAPGSDFGLTGNSSASHAAGATTAGYTNGEDIGGYNNFQYHTPAGLLPNDVSIKVAYAPNTNTSANASSNAGSSGNNAGMGTNALQYQVSATPVEGASLSASYFTKEGAPTNYRNDYEAFGASGKYAVGPVSLGVGRFHVQPSTIKGTANHTNYYDNLALGVSFAVNDALSLSFTEETSEANKITTIEDGTGKTKTQVETKITAVQAAYTMGGMTLSLSQKDLENMDYTAAVDAKETVVAIVMAF
jgi:hypothetical protein